MKNSTISPARLDRAALRQEEEAGGASTRFNIAGNQGDRHYLRDSGVEFQTHNPSIEEIEVEVQKLNLKRKAGREALEFIEKFTGRSFAKPDVSRMGHA